MPAISHPHTGSSTDDRNYADRESRWARVVQRWTEFREPTAQNLPNRRVVFAFPALLLLVLITLTSLGLTGSSTGILHQFLGTGSDSDLISGVPQDIRSDEWYVQTSWTISQVEQGLPAVNGAFAGGMDATVQHDLPSYDWSVAFRPHLVGFWFLPLDNAMALKWWLPGLALIAAAYFFIVSILPRRPMSAALTAVGFFYAPFFQWWYLSITLWTAAWSLLVMATVIWLVRDKRLVPKAVLLAIVGYLTVTMGMGIYVPFIVPAVFVALAFSIGFVLTPASGDRLVTFRTRLRSVIPLFAAGAVGVAVLVTWILTRLPTIQGFLGTVYPGERLQATGGADIWNLIGLFGAPAAARLQRVGGMPLGPNASEASTFFLPGLFLLIPFIWFLIDDRRRGRRVDWLVMSILGVGVLFFAFLVIPGWDPIAHLLLLDRTTTGRLRMGFGLLSIVAVALFIARHDRIKVDSAGPMPRFAVILSLGLATLTVAGLVAVLLYRQSPLITQSWSWLYISVLFLASVFSYASGRMLLASLAFAIVSVLGSSSVNPVYRGVYNVNETQLVKEMKAISLDEPGAWVGVSDSFLPTVILVQSGLDSYNGFQSSPPEKMWEQIDPEGDQEVKWNRLANVSWSEGSGNPEISNPAPDQIHLTFDSCSQFAQANVEHVLATSPLDQSCLALDEQIKQGRTNFWIYEVTPD